MTRATLLVLLRELIDAGEELRAACGPYASRRADVRWMQACAAARAALRTVERRL